MSDSFTLPKVSRIMMVLFALWCLFFALGTYDTFGSHEVYTVVPAREMIESADWLVPTYGGIPRLTKPPLMYWILSAIGTVTGTLNEWLSRIPIASSSFGLAVIMGLWAKRWYGGNAGWIAFFIQSTSVYVLYYGRRAEVDMLLCLLTTSALFLFSFQTPEENRRRRFLRWVAIYSLLSLSWMLKFHYGLVMVVLPIIFFLFIQKRKRELWHVLNPVGLCLLGVSVVLWPWLIWKQLPDAISIWRYETIGRSLGEMGTQSPLVYVWYLLILTLPWSIYVLQGMNKSWKQALHKKSETDRFLWIWFASNLLVLFLSANKHPNYLISLLPCTTLWGTPRVLKGVRRIQQGRGFFQRVPGVLLYPVALVGPLIPAVLFCRKDPQWVGLLGGLSIVTSLGLALLFLSLRKGKIALSCYSIGFTFLIVYSALMWSFFPKVDDRKQSVEFVQHLRNEYPIETPFHLYQMGQTPLAFYLDSPVVRIEDDQSLRNNVESDSSLLLLAFEEDVGRIQKSVDCEVLTKQRFHTGWKLPRHSPLVLLKVQRKILMLSPTLPENVVIEPGVPKRH